MAVTTFNCECGNHAFFNIGRGYVAMVDVKDVPVIDQYAWHSIIDGHVVYAGHRRYFKVNGKAISWLVKIHQKLLCAPRGWVVDHINRNGLDNRSSNMRPSDNSQNIGNSKHRRNAFGFRGVSIDRRLKKRPYYAHIAQSHLGFFATPEEAARAHDAAALARWGEFATLNFPAEHSHHPAA